MQPTTRRARAWRAEVFGDSWDFQICKGCGSGFVRQSSQTAYRHFAVCANFA